jgi:flagellar biosynthesis/type III secretory pathway M-ring protein FliF/YscJ
MEFLKAQLTRVQEQLAGLSASQKMLTASLVAIMVMTVLFWSHWAAEPEMEALLPNQSLTTDDISSIVHTLDAQAIPHSVVGDKVMVPADRKLEILAELGYSQALPRDFNNAFDDLVLKQSNIMDAPDKTAHLYLEAKNRTLAMVIGRFPGVASASVMIDPTMEPGFNGAGIQKSAGVSIITRRDGKSNPKKIAESAADLVSGAEAGLLRSKIRIVMDGAPVQISDRDGDGMMAGNDIVDAINMAENVYRDKILKQFGDISGLMVSVTVKLNTASTLTNSVTADPKQVVSTPKSNEERTTETPIGAAGGGQDPGTVANGSLSVQPSSAAGAGASATTSDTKIAFDTLIPTTSTTTRKGPGDFTAQSASIRVPRSHFINAWKIVNPGKDPDEATLSASIEAELANIRKQVKGCTGIENDDGVIVAEYTDAPVDASAPSMAVPSAVTTTLAGYSKEIGVGLLAVVSLFMVLMMVRKGVPAPTLVVAAETTEPNSLNPNEMLAGEVGDSNAMLDAVELDDSAVKSQQMLDQVQQMVQTNPDAAATLVKRWMNRT